MNSRNRFVVGLLSMIFGLCMIVFAAYLGGQTTPEGTTKNIVMASCAVGGCLLTFGVSRRLLTSEH